MSNDNEKKISDEDDLQPMIDKLKGKVPRASAETGLRQRYALAIAVLESIQRRGSSSHARDANGDAPFDKQHTSELFKP